MTSSEGAGSARGRGRPRRARSSRSAAARLTEAPAPPKPENPATAVAADAVVGTDPVGMPVLGEAVSDLGEAFAQMGTVSGKGRTLTRQLVRILAGSSDVTPDPKDWRFPGPGLVGTPGLPPARAELPGWLRLRQRGARRPEPQRPRDDRGPLRPEPAGQRRRPDQLPGRQSGRPQAWHSRRPDGAGSAARATSSATCCATVGCPPRWIPARS